MDCPRSGKVVLMAVVNRPDQNKKQIRATVCPDCNRRVSVYPMKYANVHIGVNGYPVVYEYVHYHLVPHLRTYPEGVHTYAEQQAIDEVNQKLGIW